MRAVVACLGMFCFIKRGATTVDSCTAQAGEHPTVLSVLVQDGVKCLSRSIMEDDLRADCPLSQCEGEVLPKTAPFFPKRKPEVRWWSTP